MPKKGVGQHGPVPWQHHQQLSVRVLGLLTDAACSCVVQVHGFMMFMAWGILIPFGMLAARYLKNRDWFK